MLDANERTFARDGERITLDPKAYEVLLMLIEFNGRLVTKQEIFDRVWSDTFVDENNIQKAATGIRKALGKQYEHFIETVHGHGYRFNVPVKDVSGFFDEDCPWLGLDALDDEHGEFLIGREREIKEIVTRLKQTNFVAIQGLSGTGKSSLLQAGVKPKLDDIFADERKLKINSFRPGRKPLLRLAQEIAQILPRGEAAISAEEIESRLLANDEFLKNIVVDSPNPAEFRLIWVIDQFEEAITGIEDEEKQRFVRSFLSNILRAAENPRQTFLIALRADLINKLLAFSDFWKAVSTNPVLLVPMNPDDLRRVITEPANRLGIEIEAGLTDELLRDVGDETSALPLLSHTLKELFLKREGRKLTFIGYNNVGRVRQALARYADKVFLKLNDAEREQVKTIFLKLIHVDEVSDSDARLRVGLSELQTDENSRLVEDLVNQLTAERLLTCSQSVGTDEIQVEISHETLLKHWSRLQDWIDENRRIIWALSGLSNSAKQWSDNNRADGFLLPETRLAHYHQTLAGHEDLLKANAKEFLEANTRAFEARRQEAAEAERKTVAEKRAAERRKSINRRLKAVVAAAVFFLLISGAFIVILWRQNNQITKQRDLIAALQPAYAAQSELKNDSQLSLLLAIEAAKITEHPTVFNILREVVAQTPETSVFPHQPEVVASVNLNPDETKLATAGYDKTLKIWDTNSKKILLDLAGHSDDVTFAAFNRDGTKVASSSKDHSFRTWDAQTGENLLTIPNAHKDSVNSITFSPDGTVLLTAGSDLTARLWNAQTGEQTGVLEGHESWLNSAAFSPNGRFIATAGGDKKTGIWNVDTKKLIRFLEAQNGTILNVSFNPDGTLLATAAKDGTVFVWDTATWQPKWELQGHAGQQVNSAEFSSDGRWLVTTGNDLQLKIWNMANGSPVISMKEHKRSVIHAKFSRDNQFVYSAGADGAIIRWKLPVAAPVQSYSQHDGKAVYSAEFSPDGKFLVTAGNDKSAVVWNVAENKVERRLLHEESVQSAVFSADGKRIATASQDKKGRIWDAETGNLLTVLSGHGEMLHFIALSSDGKIAVTAGKDGVAILWDAGNGAEIKRLQAHAKEVTNVSFSPDNALLVTTSADNTILLWDVQTGTIKTKWDVETGRVNAAFFDSEGKWVIAACGDGTIRIYDVNDYSNVTVLRGHTDGINFAKFNPQQNSIVVSASRDKTARVWLREAQTPFLYLLDSTDSVLSASFSPDGKTITTSDKNGTVKLFSCTFCAASLPELISVAQSRIVRQLTPGEKQKYGL